MSSIEELYLESAKKLKTSLPKFLIFLGIAYIIWLVSITFFLPLNQGILLGRVEAVRLEGVIIIAAIIILLFFSIFEVRNVADACAGLFAAYVNHSMNVVEELRFRQLKRSFRNIGYIFPLVVTFLIFNPIFERINPIINKIIPVIFVVWVVIAGIVLAMVLGIEVEEATKRFLERVERLRKIRIRKKIIS